MKRALLTFAAGVVTAGVILATPIVQAANATIFLSNGEGVRIERSDDGPDKCTLRKLKIDKINNSNGGLFIHC